MKRIQSLLNKPIPRIAITAILFALGLLTEHLGAHPASWITLYVLALLVSGLSVFVDAVKGILRRDLLDEKFLMSIASIGAMIVGEWSEGVAVMLFFLVGETFEHIAVRRSRSSIKSLMDFMPDEATLLTDDGEERVDAEDVEVGSVIIIRPGERVPIDSLILSDSSDVDTSSLTGESIPRPVREGDTVESGTVVINGTLTARTIRPSDESSAARILALVEDATENKAPEESFITSFSHYYTPIVVIIAILVALIPPLFGWLTLGDSVYRALILLVISCPCALVISVPMAFFSGIGGGASRGILFKGGNVFSALARASVFAFDKTGTVTDGSFGVDSVITYGVSRDELLSLAASAEQGSNHPIARSISDAGEQCYTIISLTEHAGEGVVAELDVSGVPTSVAVGNSRLMSRLGISAESSAGGLLVAKNNSLIGEIIIRDKLKNEARDSLLSLRTLGAKELVMISGDKTENATRVANEVGIEKVLSEMTPESKYKAIEDLIKKSSAPVVYVGDGINDSPSLVKADVGIAMGSLGQDSAIEAADIVITTDNLSKIPEAIRIARKTVSIVKFNIVFAIGIKLLILILGVFNLANMWLAVFADVGVAVIAILNSMRALRISK